MLYVVSRVPVILETSSNINLATQYNIIILICWGGQTTFLLRDLYAYV